MDEYITVFKDMYGISEDDRGKAEREKEGDKKGAEKVEAQDEVAEVSETASEE